MSEKASKKGLIIIVFVCIAMMVVFIYEYYFTKDIEYVTLGQSSTDIFMKTNRLNISNIGQETIHIYNPSELYIHIGNSTLRIYEVNGTIIIEGAIINIP